MSATRFGGQSQYELKDHFNASNATVVVGQMGVKDLSPVDLRKVLAGKNVNSSPVLGGLTEGFRGQCGSNDSPPFQDIANLDWTEYPP